EGEIRHPECLLSPRQNDPMRLPCLIGGQTGKARAAYPMPVPDRGGEMDTLAACDSFARIQLFDTSKNPASYN
ncbi:hypothetical protein AAEH76_22260, partial [Shewanella algae]|uniref:hypothetical protein n=1 Tax=Shewanella algae TaxID=38313 RepID=UPI00313E62C3